jgi:hypothetical protein
MIRKAYSFTARGDCTATGYDLEALCVFFDTRRTITLLEFFDELTTSLRELTTLPDTVLVIADAPKLDTLYKYWIDNASDRDLFKDRGVHRDIPFVKSYQFATWNADKGLNIAYTDGHSSSKAFSLPMESFVGQGLKALIAANPVVQVAPAGHVFRHPSKTINKVFIQARELAISEAELAFAGRCLACALPSMRSADLMQVYIDSMGIYSLVREALSFAGSSASIHSFHSYDEISKLSPPTEPYAVVISASTSGGMAQRLNEEQEFDADRLITLIDASKHGRKGEVLIALDEIDPDFAKQLSDGTETQIELFGEHFYSKAKPPRAVTLGQMHTPKALPLYLKQLGIAGTLDLNASSRGSGASRLVGLDNSAVAGSEELDLWLKDEVAWRVPVSIDHLVHADDPGSRVLATKAAQILHLAKGGGTAPALTNYNALSGETLGQSKGVLVVQAVAGDGGLLREISRDLREYLPPSVPRHFMVAVGMPQTTETWLRLQQFLVKNASPREYGFSSWLTLPIGSDGTGTAWQTYALLAAKAQLTSASVSGVERNIAEESMRKAAELIRESFNGFLPTSDGKDLGLTDGFVFFGSAFDGRLPLVPTSTIFATVASVLQAARDLANPAYQLRPTGYESVVLAPENFQRFNDNLLQACILRAAYPSELDYSSSPHLSGLMKEFLLKLFARRDHPYGAAALEFAAALASGRVRLAANDVLELRSKAIETLASWPSPLLGFLCLME